MKTYILPNFLRKKLRKPLGISILGKKTEVIKKFQQLLEKKRFKKIITVGDYCSLTLPSDVKIFDGRIKRRKINPPPNFWWGALKCSNPRGTIQKGVWQVIKKALKKNKNVFVEGEEDLLAIPAVLLSGKKTAVVYGLPNKGICLIEISPKIKKIFRELLKKFKTN
jgi:hypothetical protein